MALPLGILCESTEIAHLLLLEATSDEAINVHTIGKG